MPEIVGEKIQDSTYLVSFSRDSILIPPCQEFSQNRKPITIIKEIHAAGIDQDALKLWKSREDKDREALTLQHYPRYESNEDELKSEFDSESRGICCLVLSWCPCMRLWI